MIQIRYNFQFDYFKCCMLYAKFWNSVILLFGISRYETWPFFRPLFFLSLDHPREIVDPQQVSCCLVFQRAESINPVQDHSYEYSYGCPSPQAGMGGSKGVRSPTPNLIPPSLCLTGPCLPLFFSQFLWVVTGTRPNLSVTGANIYLAPTCVRHIIDAIFVLFKPYKHPEISD